MKAAQKITKTYSHSQSQTQKQQQIAFQILLSITTKQQLQYININNKSLTSSSINL